MKIKHIIMGLIIFYCTLLFQASPVFGNSKLISLNGLPQPEETEKIEGLIVQKLQKQGLNTNTIPLCEITISNSSNGYKISTLLKNKATERVHSYLPLYSVEIFAEIISQDIGFLSHIQEPGTPIEPSLNHYLQTKQIKRIFPQLPEDFLPTALGFAGNNLILYHNRGTLELSPHFRLTDQSAEDIYNWNHLDIKNSTQACKFTDFTINVKTDNTGLIKTWFQPDKQEEISLPLLNLDYLFSNHNWELSLVKKKQLIHLNVHDFSQEAYPFSPGFITAATMCSQGLWVYNSLDKRLHLYSRAGLWIKSQRPQIRNLQNPFALIILEDKSYILCDYGQIYGLDQKGKPKWTIKNYRRQGISYSLPAFFYPALSPDNKEFYILDFQAEELMRYSLKNSTETQKTALQFDAPEKAIVYWIKQEEHLLAFQTLFANEDTMNSHQYRLQEKNLRIALKKKLCQGLLSRAETCETNLNFKQAAELLTYYTTEMRELQRLEPLNMELPNHYQKTLEKRNQLLQRINQLTYQKPDTKELALSWEIGHDKVIHVSLATRHKRWPLPITATLKIPGFPTPFRQTLENHEQLQHFYNFLLTDEMAHHAPITLSLVCLETSKEFLWSETLETIAIQPKGE